MRYIRVAAGDVVSTSYRNSSTNTDKVLKILKSQKIQYHNEGTEDPLLSKGQFTQCYGNAFPH